MKELIVKVTYISEWDGGATITTSASLNIRTGEITEIISVNPPCGSQTCKREYIVFNDEQYDVIADEDNGYWAKLHSGHTGPCTKNYLEHVEAMAALSITHIVKAVNYITALSQYLDDDSEILDEMDSVVDPLYDVINKLKTSEECRHNSCNSNLFKSDLPQYDYVCPECDENF